MDHNPKYRRYDRPTKAYGQVVYVSVPINTNDHERRHLGTQPKPAQWLYARIDLPAARKLIAVVPLANPHLYELMDNSVQRNDCTISISTNQPSLLGDGGALGPELHRIFPVVSQKTATTGDKLTKADLVVFDIMPPYNILNFLARQKPASTDLPTHMRPLGYVAQPPSAMQESCTVTNAAAQPVTFSLTRYSPRIDELAVPDNSFLQQGIRVVHVHRGLAQAAHRKEHTTERVLASISTDKPPQIYFETRVRLHGLR